MKEKYTIYQKQKGRAGFPSVTKDSYSDALAYIISMLEQYPDAEFSINKTYCKAGT